MAPAHGMPQQDRHSAAETDDPRAAETDDEMLPCCPGGCSHGRTKEGCKLVHRSFIIYTGTEYGISVLMISESLISLSELIMHA